MEKINLKKYGFVRLPAEDFSDDETRFKVYRLDNVHVTYASDSDYVYISGRYRGNELCYEEYSKLRHYGDVTDSLNGVARSQITDEALKAFVKDCVDYQREYEEAVKNLTYPTENELFRAYEKVREVRCLEYVQIQEKLNSVGLKIFKLDDYALTRLKRNYLELENVYEAMQKTSSAEKARQNKGTNSARFYLLEINRYLKPSYTYNNTMEILEKIS